MALELKVRRVVTKEVANRYQKASKQEVLTNQHSGCQNLKERADIGRFWDLCVFGKGCGPAWIHPTGPQA
jgi:hypothetical protein